MRKTFIFILGAADPEMSAIEKLLNEAKAEGREVEIRYATKGGKRVHPGNAYQADLVEEQKFERTLVFVECRGIVDSKTQSICDMVVIDHHRSGDPGYGKTPEQFLSASSIGQVVLLLSDNGLLPDYWTFGDRGREWIEARGPWSGARDMPKEIIFTAAGDHCLGAAYQGKCPGVDPDELMCWRLEVKTAFQKRPIEELLADVEAARQKIRVAPEIILKWEDNVWPANESDEELAAIAETGIRIRDLRGPIIPELPDAACREGVAFLAGPLADPDGRQKIVLQNASPEAIRLWLAGEGCPEVVDRYGDPERGFAGGYLRK